MRPSRLSVEHRPHLEVVFDDPGTRLDPTRVYRGSISKEDFCKGASHFLWSNRMWLVESRSQSRARRQMLPQKQALARLSRMEGLSRRSRITKENGMHPFRNVIRNAERRRMRLKKLSNQK